MNVCLGIRPKSRRFHSSCRCPKRTWIHAIWMQCQHLLVEVQRGRCTRQAGVKIMEVSAGFVDVTRRAVGVKNTMTSYDCFRMKGLDLIERAQPLASCLFIALREI